MRKTTGSVIPLGDGLTGKSVLTQLLVRKPLTEEERKSVMQTVKKSLNIEMEFLPAEIQIEEETVKTLAQFYVFPGQRQKQDAHVPTFDDILNIFAFMPGLKNLLVLLLVYDLSRFESLKSLESWVAAALKNNWVNDSTLTILVSHKTDLQKPDYRFITQVIAGIKQLYTIYDQQQAADQIQSFSTSAVTGENIDSLRAEILRWIALHGKST